MGSIKVGVVGLNFGLEHVMALQANPRFEIVAICDIDQAKLDALRGDVNTTSGDAVWYQAERAERLARVRSRADRLRQTRLITSYHDFLAMPEVEAVILAVPVHLNAAFAERAVAAGKHVLAAKPFALTLEDGERLLAAVKASDRAFVLGFQFRYSPLFRRVRDVVDSGVLGDIRQLFWNMTRMPLRAAHNRRDLSGGPYLAECCHWFDLFDLMQPDSGVRFSRVAAFGGLDVPNTHVDFADNAVTIVEYESGVRASLNFTYFTNQPEYNVFGIQATDGKLRGDTEGAGHFVMWAGRTQDRFDFAADPTKAWQGHLGFDRNQDVFADAIESGDHEWAVREAERGLENLRICLAAERALDSGQVVHRDDVADLTVAS
ncbi:MAG: Gfo/Idh/MocA family oxidoreductase [Chloroflexi bacterium]|nr:Gfo/Idh/MocA family oxidoreductase [Chloroflexota bacterium]